jgi:DNA-binding transcriptional regulator YiaG
MKPYTTFDEDLKEKLKDPEFKRSYEREWHKLRLGHRIHQLREKLGLTQKEFAKRLKTSQGAITRMESGEYASYNLRTLQKIAFVTGARLDIRLHL